jgi:inhibitor of KinA
LANVPEIIPAEFTISPLSDTGLIIQFGNAIDETINKKILGLFHRIKTLAMPAVKDVVPAYSSLVIHYDIAKIKADASSHKTAYEIINEEIRTIIDKTSDEALIKGNTVRIPVCYADKYAPDINYISKEKKLPVDKLIRLHTARKYRVYMIGFLPGFPYMGEVDSRISIPRKTQPRTKVAGGSVGIAGMQTGIYPFDSPGGWQIIGKTPIQLFNKENENPVLVQAGDEVQFYSISEDEFANY